MVTTENSELFEKDVYTTGEAAELCNVSQQTIIRCFDNGRLRGFRVPGSRFRRITRDALIEFMQANDIPCDRLLRRQLIRVLVVDDEPALIEMLVESLERDGRFEVATAGTGFEAGKKAAEFRPDVIILDYMLPDINGNRVITAIRSDPHLKHVKIVIVSGVVNREEVRALVDVGADGFMQKPFSIEELVNRITALVA